MQNKNLLSKEYMIKRFPFEKEEHARWLYMCVIRASKKLVLVR